MAWYGPGGTRSAALALTAALAVLATGCAGGPAADRAAQLAASEQRESPSPGPAPDDDAGGGTPGGGPSGGQEPGTPGGPGGEPEPEPTPTDPPAAPAEGGATVERTFALDGVSAPWGLAVLPDGDLLVGSRDTGTVHRLNPDTGDTTTVGTVQAAEPGSGRGLLGLDTDGSHVYAFYSTASDSRVSRFVYSPDRAEGSQLSPAQGLVTGMPIESVANGGAVALGPDELLYAATAQGRPGEGTAGDVLTRVTLAGNDPDASHGPGGRIASGDPGVRAFDWDQVGRLWYLAGDGMLRCLEAGAAPGSATQQDVGLPEGAAGLVYASAALWVSDPLTDVLWRLPLDGADPVADATAVSLGTSESLGVVRAADGDRLWALSGSELLEISVS